MRDKNKKVLYIGKAKNIKQRMQNYKSGREDSRLQIPFLLEKVTSIDTFITITEKEALILENTLIKKHKPKYNVLLKDDKNYQCLAIKTDSPSPRISIERYPLKNSKGFIISKPFTSGLMAKTHFDIIRRVFKLRSCSDSEFKSRTRPCILYNIEKCHGPCVQKCTKTNYDSSVRGAKYYLSGDTAKVKKYLKEQITSASEKMQYEKASHFHKMLEAIEKTGKGSVRVTSAENVDVFAIIRKAGFCIIYKLVFRKNLLIDGNHFTFESVASDAKEALSAFLLQHYEEAKDKPKYIYTPEVLPEEKDLSSLLKIKVTNPKIGAKQKLLDLALENAKEVFEREALSTESSKKILLELKKKLSLKKLPTHIECIDTSCLAGKDAVASVVVFKNGIPDRSSYRNYHISEEKYSDDISAMKETLRRRYSKIKEHPDLIIIDGGKGQLSTLKAILAELNIINIEICALTKEEHRHDKGLTKERVFILHQKLAITFDRHSELLFFLQNIRDEAHRRAITFHRKKKIKTTIASKLDAIAGIGPQKKKLLLKTFGSVKGIKEAPDQDILALPSLSQKDLKNLRDIL